MKTNHFPKFLILGVAMTFVSNALAGTDTRNVIRVNSEVTTHIVMPENLKMVDISTDKIIGNQCSDNLVRIKPAPADSIGIFGYTNREYLGTITLIGERHLAQYDIVYDSQPQNAASFYNVSYEDTHRYTNPEISMPESEMAKFAWAIYGSKRKFNNIRTNANGIRAQIYNIYTIGNYFFVDFGLENRTNIEYDIDEIRVTLTDKKETKSTNSQSIQLSPVYMLNKADRFKKNYRQVMVLDKLTFPDEKIINIAISENQISGRTVTLKMEYADVLNADDFDISKLEKVTEVKYVQVAAPDSDAKKSSKSADSTALKTKVENLEKQNAHLNKQLGIACSEAERLQAELDELNLSYEKMEAAYKGATDTITRILSKEKR